MWQVDTNNKRYNSQMCIKQPPTFVQCSSPPLSRPGPSGTATASHDVTFSVYPSHALKLLRATNRELPECLPRCLLQLLV